MGTELQKKWIGSSVPPGSTSPTNITGAKLLTQGQSIISSEYDLSAPEDGFAATYPNGYSAAAQVNDWDPGTQSNGCVGHRDPSLAAPGWTLLVTPPSVSQGNCGDRTSHLEALFAPLVPERSDGEGLGPPEPYTGQRTNADPIPQWDYPPQTQTELETRTHNALDEMNETSSKVGQKIAYELGRPNACDPIEPNVCSRPDTIRTEDQKKCDLDSGGLGADPDPGRTIRDKDPALYVTHQSFQRRAAGGTAMVPTALKKGWTESASRTEWRGWGWRHIAAKHGWGPDDVAATAEALTYPPIGATRLEYRGPEYEKNGQVCERVVIIATEAADGEPEPPEIITSYGEQIRNAA